VQTRRGGRRRRRSGCAADEDLEDGRNFGIVIVVRARDT
jgi:hypothetical protein